MPSPIPASRLLPKDLFPSVDAGACSSPLFKHGTTLHIPAPRPGRCSRPWSSAILWSELRTVGPVGSGGFGSVFRAEYLGQSVALKRVNRSTKNRLASRHSFWAELNAAHLRHRNIARVLAASTCVPAEPEYEGSLGGVLMELCVSDLQQIIYGTDPLEENRCLRYAEDVTHGLRFLHAHGVLHLDIKPANLLLSQDDVVKIADFGCSLKLESGSEATAVSPQLSHVGGTFTHRAPELLKGEPVSAKADVFSFAITLWQLLTRDQPYVGDRQYVIYAVVAHEMRPQLQGHAVFSGARGQIYSALLKRCWSAQPQSRPSSEELLQLLPRGQDT
ncbi:hypothetical protein NQD34_014835 [Periophthalmus magnuspinnatus]|uniref:proto-oncogene serine/threonine-protein kinase mos n=1 Tax=Periophthalmus magnuspinnatus TaxID=409849 RepID=UPI00145B2A6C|nr:proto-oncogene serine/threonine-protein kinase mos [Periophthalmus magnuspinnatus]KAJ0022701.1 hypothetical protein NQD34_014835 [Periophthalmus magnuspinnatus]